VVRENLLSFLAEGVERSHNGDGYPFYIEKELRDFIGCADLSRGFARVRCNSCGYEELLPFSCKNRGICPSCTSRRMSDMAAYLVDMVLPKARYRQWTVTFPWPIRYLMAKDYKLITAVLGIVMRVLFAWQRKMAKRDGHRGAKTAAVAFIQRYGSALNCNVHPHVLLPDAVFVSGEEKETLAVIELSGPTDEDLQRVTEKIARRVSALIEKWFANIDDSGDGVLDSALKEAMRIRAHGNPAVVADDSSTDGDQETAPMARTPRRCAQLDGFSVHANTEVAAEDRAGLERICRYGMRPAFSHKRISLTDDGKVLYKLRKPWPKANGVSVLSFEPVELLRRLAPLIPPPYANLVRHFGLFAPNAKDRC
jgi:hypothetical protein